MNMKGISKMLPCKILKLEQGSKEWHEFRSKKIGSSDIAAIMGVKGAYKTRKKLMEEKSGVKEKENSAFLQNLFDEGHRIESEVREQLEIKDGVTYDNPVVQLKENENFFASIDMLNGSTYKEVKSTTKKEYLEMVARGECPPVYFHQINWSIGILGLTCGSLVCVDRATGEAMSLKVNFDNELFKIQKEEATKFLAELNSNEFANELVDARLEKIGQAKKEIEKYSKLIKLAEDENKKLANAMLDEYNATTLSGFGVTISRSERAGAVDYAKIPELKGVDLEKYRKKPSTVLTIKNEKETTNEQSRISNE